MARGQLFSRAIVRGQFSSGGIIRGASFLGGNFPRTHIYNVEQTKYLAFYSLLLSHIMTTSSRSFLIHIHTSFQRL